MTGEQMRRAGTAPTRRWGAICWLVILAIIGAVQVIRGQWGIAVLFAVAVALLALETVRPLRRLDTLPSPRTSLIAAGAGVIAIALLLSPRHSVPAGIAMAIAGVLAVLVAAPPTHLSRPGPWPRTLRRLGWAWASILIAGCIWELLEFVLGGVTAAGTRAHPTLSLLLDPLLDPAWGKLAFVVGWAALGMFLITRGRRR